MISEDLEPSTSRKPTTIPEIGDVGYISEGEFYLLFSAGSPLGERERGFDVPNEFEQLEVGPPVSVERPAGCLHSPTIRKFGECPPDDAHRKSTDLYVPFIVSPSTVLKSVPPRLSLERGTNFSFDLTGVRGAALVTTGKTHQKDSPDELRSRFKRYTKRHYKSWRQFACGRPDGDSVWPVLVTGFDVARDFAMVAYSNEVPDTDSNKISIPMSTFSPFLEEWKWRGDYPPKVNKGPGGTSTELNQRVFIRYYTMRTRRVPVFRKKIPKKLLAAAGPHDLGSGDNQGETFPELTVQQDTELTTSDDEDLGRQLGPITGGTGSAPGIVIRVRFLPYRFVSTLKFASG